jgi:hypothetical protein
MKVSYTLSCDICTTFTFIHVPTSRTKTIRRQPIINGGINVEIGNPSYNMYEVDHDHNDGGLLDPGFMVDTMKVMHLKTLDTH